MTNGAGKHPRKKAGKPQAKAAKKTAAELSREKLTKHLPKAEKPGS